MVSENVRIIEHTYSTHAYAIKHTIYDKIINRFKNLDMEGDMIMSEIQKQCKAYCFKPALAWQREGISDVLNVWADYSWLKYGDGFSNYKH